MTNKALDEHGSDQKADEFVDFDDDPKKSPQEQTVKVKQTDEGEDDFGDFGDFDEASGAQK